MKDATAAVQQEASVFADANTLEKEEEEVRKQREEYNKMAEKDTIVFVSPISFFRYKIEQPKGWVGRGKGNIRISLEPTTNKYRIVHIKDKVFKLGCNHFVEERIKLEKHPSEEHSWMWITRGDNCGDGLSPVQKYLAKFPTAEAAEIFSNAIEMIKKGKSLKEILELTKYDGVSEGNKGDSGDTPKESITKGNDDKGDNNDKPITEDNNDKGDKAATEDKDDKDKESVADNTNISNTSNAPNTPKISTDNTTTADKN